MKQKWDISKKNHRELPNTQGRIETFQKKFKDNPSNKKHRVQFRPYETQVEASDAFLKR